MAKTAASTAVVDGLGDRRPRRVPFRVMPICKGCGDEADELKTVKVDGKAKKLCEDCADRAREQAEVAEASESVVQGMMGFKGRR
jgi:hypothetical protein